MLYIVREISKLCMFVMLWGFPLLLVRWSGNYGFLWLLALSVVVSVGVFSHYEDLEKTDNLEQDNDGSDE